MDLVKFGLAVVESPTMVGDPLRQSTLGDIWNDVMVVTPVNALVLLWNSEMCSAINIMIQKTPWLKDIIVPTMWQWQQSLLNHPVVAEW